MRKHESEKFITKRDLQTLMFALQAREVDVESGIRLEKRKLSLSLFFYWAITLWIAFSNIELAFGLLGCQLCSARTRIQVVEKLKTLH